MNERIRKLAEQAGIVPGIMGLNRFTHFDPEKFAELIVAECIKEITVQMFREGIDESNNPGYYKAINRVEKHFRLESSTVNNKMKELHRKLEEDKATAQKRIAELMYEDLLDKDGYPTEAALEIVRIWHWSDSSGWFKFIKSIWYILDWGWRESEADHEYKKDEKVYVYNISTAGWCESEADHEYKKDEKVYVYNISTAGWSGNESVIREMQENTMMWHLNWVQSRRGGHYIFELKELPNE